MVGSRILCEMYKSKMISDMEEIRPHVAAGLVNVNDHQMNVILRNPKISTRVVSIKAIINQHIGKDLINHECMNRKRIL